MIAQKDFSMLNDQQLQQAMMFAQRSNNTPVFIELMTEAEKRKKIRNEQQGMQAGAQLAQGPKTQADAVIAGVANLSAPSDEKGYASGGIVSLAGGGVASLFEQFLQGRGYSMAEYARLSPQMQQAMQQAFNISNAYPAASPVPPVKTGGGYGAQPATYGQRALSAANAGIRGLAVDAAGAAAPLSSVLAGGALLSAGAANALSNATDEQLEAMSNPGADAGDNAFASAIIREGRNTAKATPAPAPKKAAPAPAPDTYPETASRHGILASIDKNQAPRLGSSGGGGSRTSSAAKSLIKAAAPTAAAAAPAADPEWMKAPKERTLEEIIADRKKAAAEGEAGIKALMDPYAAKIEERRKKIEGETADSEGILGLKWGDDKRKALRDFGFALMAGESPHALVNAGKAGKAAAEAYDAAKEKRQARMDALDERDQKLAMARYEMSRGNREEAAKLVEEADKAGQAAFKNRFEIGKFGEERKEKAKEFDLKERELAQRLQLGLEQIRATHAAAARNPQLDTIRALAADPKLLETYGSMRERPPTAMAEFDAFIKANPMLAALSQEEQLAAFMKAKAGVTVPKTTNAPVGPARP